MVTVLRSVRSMARTEIVIGRAAAFCTHPYVAWRTRSRRVRAAIIAVYAGVGYLAGLGALVLLK